MLEKQFATYLRNYNGPPVTLMEVCGTHTSSLYRSGIRQMLPAGIRLVSGPGCPVCVTPTSYIDKLVEYALTPGYAVLTFGDLLAVPGSKLSLAKARDRGGHADFLYNPEDALTMAAEHPETTYALGAVGFETTAPVWADLVRRVYDEHIGNVKFLTALKTMPGAMGAIAASGRIDGFLCPGHVAVVAGTEDYRKLAAETGLPMVVGGFTPPLLLRALSRLVLEASRKQGGFWNEYPSVVFDEGNTSAKALLSEVFTPGDAAWRGLGVLRGSGLYLSEKYAALDAGSRGLTKDFMPPGCRCDKVLTGQIEPEDCPCFGKVCTPEHPVGACMVSSEGACCVTFREK